jgi:hypothetical protein
MTENEFNEAKDLIAGLFGDGDAEIQDAVEAFEAHVAAAPATPPTPAVKDGLWYVEDGVNGDGHSISWYRLVSAGKTILWFSMDNDLAVSADVVMSTLGGVLPHGATAHAIRAHNATRTDSVATTGLAIRVLHEDGEHIDGQTVRSYVAPRAVRWIAGFYGV